MEESAISLETFRYLLLFALFGFGILYGFLFEYIFKKLLAELREISAELSRVRTALDRK